MPRKTPQESQNLPKEPSKPVRKPRKPEFSPTRIKTYLSCHMMYRLDYIDKQGKFYHRSRAGFSFGTSLHQTLQTFHEAGGAAVITPDQLKESLDAGWVSAGYSSTEHEQEQRDAATAILERYHAAMVERPAVVRTFLTEKMLKFDMGRFVLTGRIDRIDEHEDGSLEIVDYKSGRSNVTEDDVRNALAMSIYQLLARRLYPDRNVSATIHALQTGAYATVSLSDDELALLEDDIREIGHEILDKDFESVRPEPLPNVCPYCDFLPLCSRYWISHGRDFREELGI